MAEELTPEERRHLALLFRLITNARDSDVVTLLAPYEHQEKFKQLLNADIIVESSSGCSCHKLFERAIIRTRIPSLNWMAKWIETGKCQHASQGVAKPMSLRLVHQAVAVNKKKTMSFLLKCDKEVVNSKTAWLGNTPLLIAVQNDKPELVEELMAAGADVNVFQWNGNTPLIEAIHREYVRVFDLIVSNPVCDLDLCSTGEKIRNALDKASKLEDPWMTTRLLEAGADPRKSKHALCNAAGFGHVEIVRYLAEAGVDVDGKETTHTPLIGAALEGHLEICEILLDAGADPNYQHNEGYSALLKAASFGYSDIVQLLVDFGADVSLDVCPEESWGCTALHEAAWNGHTACLDILLTAGADPDEPNIFNTTAIWGAVYGRHVDVVLMLVQANVDLEVPSTGRGVDFYDGEEHITFSEPQTPLYVAVARKCYKIVGILLEAGYDIWGEEWLLEKLRTPGNVDVSSKTKKLISRLTTLCSSPPSLQHSCKMFFRKTYGVWIHDVFAQLSLPNILKDYILLNGIDADNCRIV